MVAENLSALRLTWLPALVPAALLVALSVAVNLLADEVEHRHLHRGGSVGAVTPSELELR